MSKSLVAFFSASGVTKSVSERLANVVAGKRFAADVSEEELATFKEEL